MAPNVEKNTTKNNNDVVLTEYSAIKMELSSLFQKSGILITVITIWIGFIVSIISFLSSTYSNWYLFLFILLVYPLISLILNIKILIPNLKNKKDSKFFIDYAKMESTDQLNKELNLENVKQQIIENSKILTEKYETYKISICILFFPFSLIFWIERKNK